ncbi:hypothetical protein [Paenisporosarcina sp. TG20]|uniref:hypothetical protein n=1 Tax=Paenisporosarcina sp. TG20 TaxID=1211706 RepID=UPI00030AD5A3|nr:hypothetical protein [Paenisporosarcina sp. TG20]
MRLKAGGKKNPKVFDWETIEYFLECFVFPALQGLEVTNSTVSRSSYDVIKKLTKRSSISIGDVLLEIVDCTDKQAEDIIQEHGMRLPLEDFDIHDFLVWATAIKAECEYIVTRNTNRFPARIGSIIRIDPLDFLNEL